MKPDGSEYFALPKKRNSLLRSITRTMTASSRLIISCSLNSTMSLHRSRDGLKSMLGESGLRICDSLVDRGWPCI